MSENERFGREPIEVVEIGQDLCTLKYGVVGGPESSLGDEGTTPQALVSNERARVAFREGAPTLRFNDSAGVQSQYIRAGLVSSERNAYTISANQVEDFLTAAVASGAFTVEMDLRFVAGESGQHYAFVLTDNVIDNAVSVRLSFFSVSGDDFIQITVGIEKDGVNLHNSSGEYNLGAAGTYEDTVHHFAVTCENSGSNVVTRYYFDGSFLEETTGTGSGGFEVRTMEGALGVYANETFSSRQFDLSNVRLWTVKRTDAEIDANKYRAITDTPAGLFANFIYDHASIGPSVPGCNASRFANLLPHSENTDLMPLRFYTFLRGGIQQEADGFNYQSLTIVQTNGIGAFRSEDRPFLVLEGDAATFKARFKKTAAPGVVRVEVGTEADLGGTITTGANSVDVDAQTGAFIASVGFGYFDTSYELTQDGEYVAVRVTATNNTASVLDVSKFNAAFQLDAAEGDSILAGGFQLGPSALTAGYAATAAATKEPTGDDKCFNTRVTCQDPDNYDRGVLPLRFVDKRSPIPKDAYYIPSLSGSPSVTPARLNPGGANRNASALGERASVSLTFMDHPHDDRLVDPYRKERDYDPAKRGTFWTKWRARNPYYMQRPISLRTGYLVNGEIVDEITRAFVITGFSGPDASGRVQIKGKDVLTLAEDSKAQAPFVSTGRLAADITASATSATLTPSGIGNLEYAASGFMRINKEVIQFTRSGDTLTLTRARFGTEASDHDEDDTVQQCLRYTSEAPQDILYDLLSNYAGIPEAYLDKAGWDAEALDYLPRLYSAIITEPEGVSKLIGEMCQQMYFTIWFDERESLVKMRAVRLAQDDEVYELNDNEHFIENSIRWRDLSDELITQVWVYYGQSDPTEKLDQGDNYVAVSVTVDPLAEGPDKHNLRRIKKVFSRWIDAANASAADDLGARILNRYGNAPREVTFRVDAKDRYLWLGDFARITNRLRVDRFGLPSPVNIQLFQAQETGLGSEFEFTGQEFIPALTDGDEVEDPSVRTIPITSDFLNVNLRELHDSQFGAPSGTETVTFVVRNGVTVGSDAAGGGTNVPIAQRVTANDFYDAGTSQRIGVAVGSVPILQRAGISSMRTTNGGVADPNANTDNALDYKLIEYPTVRAMRTGSWPAGVKLRLVVEAGARIVGEGGNGSCHMHTTFDLGVLGGDGGDALEVEYALEINNGGLIGGGGGGGSGYKRYPSSEVNVIVCGGGGSGLRFADTRGNSIFDTFGQYSERTNRSAAAGSLTNGGVGGRLEYIDEGFNDRNIVAGGAGGAIAASGGDAQYTSYNPPSSSTPRFSVAGDGGGQPGKAIRAGANLITWVNKGDVRGGEVN